MSMQSAMVVSRALAARPSGESLVKKPNTRPVWHPHGFWAVLKRFLKG